jgi:spore coat polysaccharide biosynthesis predicted glycosyltransferase SpsG
MGHIVRTLSLAKLLKKQGHKIIFLSRNFTESISLIKKYLFTVKSLNCSQKYHLTPLKEIIKKEKVDIIVHDFQDTSLAYMQNLRKTDRPLKLINFDDLSPGRKLADINIDANLPSRKNSLYGPKYIILREDFAKKYTRKTKARVKKILITLGGSDPNNFTEKILNILLKEKLSLYKFTILLGPGFKNKTTIKKMLKNNKNFSIQENVSTTKFISLTLENDLCLASGGITMYELACLGIPAIILCQAEHENKNAKLFHNKGIVKNLGPGSKISAQKLLKIIYTLDKNKKLREKMSLAGKKYVDGKGLKRIIKIINKL